LNSDVDRKVRKAGNSIPATGVGFLVEIADTSLEADREMARGYGASGVPIDWISCLSGSRFFDYTDTFVV
jgi:hypothetical protein